MKEHGFTAQIRQILFEDFGDIAEDILQRSELLTYINYKTSSANKDAKARGSFGNLYAIYVLVEDYVSNNFHIPDGSSYQHYEGAIYKQLFERQRQLPFGKKLQNHALNHRMNKEFEKVHPSVEKPAILRDSETKRYWINESFLKIAIAGREYNIAESIIKIIDAYVTAKQDAFHEFMADCERMERISKNDKEQVLNFIISLLRPNVDARIFEITSFAILKTYYSEHIIYWGWSLDEIKEDVLKLYKTGRTNANDGGIDFVMRPLGRFFQVTETLDVNKYFLDIDKVQRYPITFVVKTEKSELEVREEMAQYAQRCYTIDVIVNKYMNSIEEIINIDRLKQCLLEIAKSGELSTVIDEIVIHSKVEFNFME